MKGWDSDLEEEDGEEGGEREASNGTTGRGEENGKGDRTDAQGHLQKVQKLIYAAKVPDGTRWFDIREAECIKPD